MTSTRVAPTPVQRKRLVDVTVRLIADRGVDCVSSKAIGDAAGLDPRTVVTLFGGTKRLVLYTATALAADRSVPAAAKRLPHHSRTAGLLLEELTAAHERAIAASPVRFAALLQVSSAALVGRSEFLGLVAAHHRRTRTTCRAHFELLYDVGETAPGADLDAAAALFVQGMNGIAMCQQLDQSAEASHDAYRELRSSIELRLTRHAA